MTTTNPPPAVTVGDLLPVMHHFEARRYEWLAAHLRDAGLPEIAALADRWSSEHQGVADRLRAVEAKQEALS